jgi:hypothetical protein
MMRHFATAALAVAFLTLSLAPAQAYAAVAGHAGAARVHLDPQVTNNPNS